MKKILTLSRELGSGGIAIVQKLAQRLDWKIIDKEIITRVAEMAECTEGEIAPFDQEEFHRIKMLFKDIASPTTGGGLMFPFAAGGYMEPYWIPTGVNDPKIIDESRYLQLTKAVIENLAEKGNVIIVGRGGCVLLKDNPDTLHLRIVCPIDARIKRLKEVSNIDDAQARQTLERRDKSSADYLKYFYHVDWNNPYLYNLTINTGRRTLNDAEQIIYHALMED